MKKLLTVLTVLLLVSCSTDTTVPDNDSGNGGNEVENEGDPGDGSGNGGEETGDPGDDDGPAPEGTPPFGIGLVYQKSAPGTRTGPNFVLEFPKGKAEPGQEINLSAQLGLPESSDFLPNGVPEILLFKHSVESYTSYNWNTGATASIASSELMTETVSCELFGSHIGLNRDAAFGFAIDECQEFRSIRLYALNRSTGAGGQFDLLSDIYTGDTFNGIWVTENYLFVEHNYQLSDPQDPNQEGLVVYHAETLEEVYRLQTSTSKILYADGDQVFIVSRGETNSHILVDLASGAVQELESTEALPSQAAARIGGTSIHSGKVGLTISPIPGNIDYPAYFDFGLNDYVSVNEEVFQAYIHRDAIDPDREVRTPEAFAYDMAASVFAMVYLVYPDANSTSEPPTDRRLVYMDYEGNVLYEASIAGTLPYDIKIFRTGPGR